MRIRLFLSFALVILVALGSVFVFASISAEQQVRRYLGRSALAGVESLVSDLQDYFQSDTGWEGVATVFEEQNALSATATTVATQGVVQVTQMATHDAESLPGVDTNTGSGFGQGMGEGKGSGTEGMHGGQDKSATQSPSAIETESLREMQSESVDTPVVPTPVIIVTQSFPGQGQVRGKNGHMLTDASGIVVYSSGESDLGQTLDEELLAASIAINEGDETVGYLIPEGGVPQLPSNFEAQLIERIQNAAMLAAIISGVIAIILALILSQMILKPVNALRKAADLLSEGDLSQRVALKGKHELTALGKTFNQMADSLQEVETQRRDMTADIAHELRTPLAVQQANLEALQDGVYPLTQDYLKPIIKQNHLLTRLVDDLRVLALVDSGEISLNIRPVNLATVCGATAERFEKGFASSGILLKQSYEPGLPSVQADSERIEQILHNLLQNAQRYAGGENNSIMINLRREGIMAALSVRDNGPGIPEALLDKIFERFYRVDRSRGRLRGGTGLGLAIARKLAEAHNGSLTATNHPEGGAVFTLRLPLA